MTTSDSTASSSSPIGMITLAVRDNNIQSLNQLIDQHKNTPAIVNQALFEACCQPEINVSIVESLVERGNADFNALVPVDNKYCLSHLFEVRPIQNHGSHQKTNSIISANINKTNNTSTSSQQQQQQQLNNKKCQSSAFHMLCLHNQSIDLYDYAMAHGAKLITRSVQRESLFNGMSPFHCLFLKLYLVTFIAQMTSEQLQFYRLYYQPQGNNCSSTNDEYYYDQTQLIQKAICSYNNLSGADFNVNDRDVGSGRSVLHYLVNSMDIPTLNQDGAADDTTSSRHSGSESTTLSPTTTTSTTTSTSTSTTTTLISKSYAPVYHVRFLVQFLIEHGANINTRDRLGFTPLVSLIINNPGRHTLENKSAVLTLKALLMSGSDITLPDFHGHTPLLISLHLKSFRIATILLEQVNNSYNNDYVGVRHTSRLLLNMKYMSYHNNESVGNILHHLLYEYGNDCSIEAIKCLIDAGINVSQDSELGTPVFMAAWSGNLQFLKTLVEYGHHQNHLFDPSSSMILSNPKSQQQQQQQQQQTPTSAQKSKKNATPSSGGSAFKFGNWKKKNISVDDESVSNDTSTASVMDDDMRNGGGVNQQNGGDDMMGYDHVNSRQRMYEIVNGYSTVNDSIKHYFGGVEDCFSPVDRATPLHAAIARGHVKVVQYLLSMGANIKAESIISPQYASGAQRSTFTIIEILRDAMARGLVSETDGILIQDALSEKDRDYMRFLTDQYPLKDKRRSLLESGAKNHEKKLKEWNGRLF